MTQTKTRRRTITPDMAAELLANQMQNRRLDQKTANMYARAMDSGTWECSDLLPIVIDSEGRLIDGQHRLKAVVIHGRPVDFCVATSTSSIVDKMAEMRKRSVSDRLAIIDGLAHPDIQASVAKLAWLRMKSGRILTGSAHIALTVDELRDSMSRMIDDGIPIPDVCATARSIYKKQHQGAKLFRPTDIAYALVDGYFLPGDAMQIHVQSIVDDDATRTPAQSSVRTRLLSNVKLEGRWIGLSAIVRSFNEPRLKCLKFNNVATEIPDVNGGYFSRFPSRHDD